MASDASQKSCNKDGNDQKYRHHIIWLDKNIDNFNNQRKLKILKEVDPELRSFICKNECINYVREKEDRNTTSYIIFIISGALSEEIIPIIEDYSCILAIFIFCRNPDAYEHLKYPKLRAIHTDANELMDSIEMCIAKYSDATGFSVFSNKHSTHLDLTLPKDQSAVVPCSIRNLKEDQASFLWYHQMHQFMLTLEDDDDEKAKEEMISHAREQYKGKSKMQSGIDQFSTQSLVDNQNNAITWYTDNSFIYQCTNTVLRKENISQVYSYRYIIKLICHQLKELHKKYIDDYKKRKQKNTLRLYRGQHLKLEEIQLLASHIKSLISLNGFVSTTTNGNIAMEFIKNRKQQGFEPVLFKIDVDMTSEHSVAFADVSKLSQYPGEKEVLLSIGSVFRVKSVDYDEEDELHIVHLSLSQHNELTVNTYIEQTYAQNVDSADRSVLFGKLLYDMGECDAAIKYFSDAINRLSDNTNQLRATYLNNIGVCHVEMKREAEALKYYKEALKVYERTNNKRGLSACQHNIASIYHAQGDHQKALQLALKAFDIRQDNKADKASTLDLLGCIHLALLDAEAAFNAFEESLHLRLKYWGKINPYHPDIGVSYHNLGKAISKTANYMEARNHYLRADEIYRHNYSQSHTLVRQISKCLERTQ